MSKLITKVHKDGLNTNVEKIREGGGIGLFITLVLKVLY